jgi:hypothetical protein
MSDEDDIPTRENVPDLKNHPAFRQNNDDDLYPDVERIKKLVDPDAYPKPGEIPRLDARPEFQQKTSKEVPKDKAKGDKEDRLIQNYISHLNLVINWGSYNEFLDSKEVIKMAQIKSHMGVSRHP